MSSKPKKLNFASSKDDAAPTLPDIHRSGMTGGGNVIDPDEAMDMQEEEGEEESSEVTSTSQPTYKVDLFGSVAKLAENDKHLIYDLQRRIEDQRRDLEMRNVTVMALQKNFESLSTLCRNERRENLVFKRNNEMLLRESDENHAEIQVMRERIVVSLHRPLIKYRRS